MLKLSGEVRSSFERKGENGKVFMNSYQVEISNGEKEKKKLVDLNEFGEKGSFHVGQNISDVPVKFKKSDYNDEGIEFQVVKGAVLANGKLSEKPKIGNV